METPAHRIEAKERTSDVKLSEKIPFNKMVLSPGVRNGLHRAGYVYPTVLQANAIPIGKAGIDLIVQSKSGTGKTLIFTVVLLEAICESPGLHPQALILAPTREIALQIENTVNVLGSCCPKFKAVSVIGGLDVAADRKKLQHARVIVGTPGRVLHLIHNEVLNTSEIKLLVLDEADKMMSSTFRGDFEQINKCLPSRKQVIACSATFCNELDNVLAKYMRNPFLISTEKRTTSLLGIKQLIYSLAEEKTNILEMQAKVSALCQIFSNVSFKQCLVFSNSQSRAESYKSFLNKEGWPCDVISGAQDQATRIEVFNKFREFKTRILVATDLMARGIDSEHVNLVINLELPDDGATYLHRIGRAGRFGSHGIAISFIASKKDREKLRKLLEKIGFAMELLKFPKSRIVDLWNFNEPEEERIQLGVFDGNESIEYEKENINNNRQNEPVLVNGGETALKRLSLEKDVKRDVLRHLIDPKSPTKFQNRNGNLFSDFIEEVNSNVSEIDVGDQNCEKETLGSENTRTCLEDIKDSRDSIDKTSKPMKSKTSLLGLVCDRQSVEDNHIENNLFDDFIEISDTTSLEKSVTKEESNEYNLPNAISDADERQAGRKDEDEHGLNEKHAANENKDSKAVNEGNICEDLRQSLCSLLIETKTNQKIGDLFDDFMEANLQAEVPFSVQIEKSSESEQQPCKESPENNPETANCSKEAIKEAIREVHKSIVSPSESSAQIASLQSFSEPQPSTSMQPIGPSSGTSIYPRNSIQTSDDQTNHDLFNMSSLAEDANISLDNSDRKKSPKPEVNLAADRVHRVGSQAESLSSETSESSTDIDSATETAPEQYESSGFDEEISGASSGVVTSGRSSCSDSSDISSRTSASDSSVRETNSYDSSSEFDSDSTLSGNANKCETSRNYMNDTKSRDYHQKYNKAFTNWTQLYWNHVSQIQDYVNFYKYAKQQSTRYS